NGRHPMSHDLRRRAAAQLGIPPEAVGLAPSRPKFGPDDLDAKVVEAQARWRAERRWLNQHRGELARLAVDLYPAEERVPGTPLIGGPGWMPSGPMELRTLRLGLDERPVPFAVDGSEPETLPVRPLCSSGAHFDRYTSAI